MKQVKPLKIAKHLRHDPHATAKQVAWTILIGLLWLIASVFLVLAVWYESTFDMEFAELLYTILSPVGGTGQSTLSQILSACLPPVLLSMLLYVGLAIAFWGQSRPCRIARAVIAVVCVFALLLSLIYATSAFRILRYIDMQAGETTIYEDYYVDPDTVKIYDTDGEKKNLIYIYLESMETTYASKEVGGEQEEINYIPNLTELAMREENVSFSDGEGLGGFHNIAGTAWTMGSLLSTTSGVPFSLAVLGEDSYNSQGKFGDFLDRMTALGDILEKEGYRQEFLCGSDAAFAGRNTYFKNHGNYEIFDLYSARWEGYIPLNYYEWWGYEDYILYDIAKDELTELASGDQPFNFTMLTVDTHHVGGYRCEKCPDTYDTDLENVIACADNLVSDFLSWIEQQPFYEDTVIIISGDHTRMDKQLVSESDFMDRTIYNCFIHSEVDTENVKNRNFTPMDMFPTILAAMGYTIEGDRLGLGTNLFSDQPTLTERFGYEWVDAEISKYSSYYVLNFV